LEWDRVHLTSVSNYDFPAAQPYDEYIGEKWFIRNRLNLQAEAIALTKALLTRDISGLFMEEGQATMDARFEYSSERLRLLFVGITRARKELVITWNTGKSPRQEAREALALTALRSLWNAENQ
jgi:DNA helicase-2/ATP-dependent DNA helicase PcrA